MIEVDVLVLGGGPGGYPAAIRATGLGKSVALVEEARLGGTCLNVGCIPTKAWVQAAHAFHDAGHGFADMGVQVQGVRLDFAGVQAYTQGIVATMVQGVGGLLKATGVQVIEGRGEFAGPNELQVSTGETVHFAHAVIATGAAPVRPPVPGIDHAACVDSTGLLAIERVPERVVVLGGGVIGVEFASILEQFGAQVEIIEMLDHLIAIEDGSAIAALEKAFSARGIALHLGARATEITDGPGGAALIHFTDASGAPQERAADLILVATGRRARVEGLGLDVAGVAYEATHIPANAQRQTNVPHIYAVGDVAGDWQLAHTAFQEGEVAAGHIAGHDVSVGGAVPRCIYTTPEIGAVGLTESQARAQYGDDVVVGMFPYAAVARAAMYRDTTGFVKTIHESRYGALLGMVCVGTQATELINAGVVAIDAEARIDTIGDAIAAHPTLAEAVKEAALVALDRPIHMPRKRR